MAMNSVGEIYWSRGKYPLEILSKSFEQSSPAILQREEANKTALYKPPISYLGNNGSLGPHKSPENVQNSDNSSAEFSLTYNISSFESSSDENSQPENVAFNSSVIQPQGYCRDRPGHDVRQWAHNGYLLQKMGKAAKQCPLGALETGQIYTKAMAPPLQPEQKGAIGGMYLDSSNKARLVRTMPLSASSDPLSSAQLLENDVVLANLGNHNWKRRKYPLQPNTSVSMPQTSALSLAKEKVTQLDTIARNDRLHSDKVNSHNQQMYPTLPPFTGSGNLPPSPPTSGSEVSRFDKQPLPRLRESSPFVTDSMVWHRHKYPLQISRGSTTNQGLPTPPQSPREEIEDVSITPKEEPTLNHQDDIKMSFRRQSYPLQVPNIAVNSQFSASPSASTGENSENEGGLFENNSREVHLAAKVVKHWRRQIYPLPDYISPLERPRTPQILEKEAKNDISSNSVHLPKNIRAVTEAGNKSPGGRTIVVCLDGTGDKFDNDNSNIVHLISALKKDDPNQETYYQAGIGTYTTNGLSAGVSAALDMAVGSGLGLHIRDAYHFLMHTYKEGDKICIFGFSRGAYTARCLAGMIHKIGLLPPRNVEQIPFAYSFYKDSSAEGWKQSEDFKRTFCINVCVYFIGCFDSVTSVGFIPRQLPLSITPKSKPRYFRHAMALDERRAKFQICRHQSKEWDKAQKLTLAAEKIANCSRGDSQEAAAKLYDNGSVPYRFSVNTRNRKGYHPNLTNEEYESLTRDEALFETDVLEIWFAGAHADIGGGAVPNEERHKLAQIPLRWMIRQAFECNTGIIFKTEVLAEHGLDVHTLWPKYERLSAPLYGPPPSSDEKYQKGLPPRSIRRSKLIPTDRQEDGEHLLHLNYSADEDWTPEQLEDFYDAISPLNDQLVQSPFWWILEIWPVRYKVLRALGEAYTRIGMNLGQYRGVEDYEPNVHWTVLHRVQQMNYKIGARTAARARWQTAV